MTSATEKIVRLIDGNLKDSTKLIEITSQIPEMIDSNSLEVKPLISPMIKLLSSHNSVIKKNACEFLIESAKSYPEVALLAGNILNQDIKDPNPSIRSTALTTLCSLQGLDPEQTLNSIRTSLKDSNPLVRKAAVTGTGKYFKVNPEAVKESDLIDALYSMIKDSDPVVITFALQTLNIILKEEGGVVITKSMAHYLINRLQNLPELEFCFVLDYLERFYSLRESDSLIFINVLDSFLDSKSGPIVLASSKLFAKAIKNLNERVTEDFSKRINSQFCKFLRKNIRTEFLIQSMDFLLALDFRNIKGLFPDLYKSCFLKSNDQSEVVIKRVSLLKKLHSVSIPETATEIEKYFLDQLINGKDEFRTNFILALCEINSANLLETLNSVLLQEGKATKRLLLKHIPEISKLNSNNFLEFIDFLNSLLIVIYSAEKLKQCEVVNCLWILSNYEIPDGPCYLNKIFESYSESMDNNVVSLLLFTAVKVFSQNPIGTQFVLGRIMELAYSQGLESRVRFYSRVLQSREAVTSLRKDSSI